MVLIKRIVTCPELSVEKATNPAIILGKLNHDATSGLLIELQQLFSFAHQIFGDLAHTAGQTGARVKNLSLRVDNCLRYLPKAEEYLQSMDPTFFSGNSKTEWSSSKDHAAQLFTRASNNEALMTIYKNCSAPPDFSSLDEFQPGEKCLSKYTNPNFFIDEWLQQQKRERDKIKETREIRRASRAKKAQIKRQAEQVPVKKLQKTRYNQYGEKIVEAEDGTSGTSQPDPRSRGAAKPSSTVVLTSVDASEMKAPSRSAPSPPPGMGTLRNLPPPPAAINSPAVATPPIPAAPTPSVVPLAQRLGQAPQPPRAMIQDLSSLHPTASIPLPPPAAPAAPSPPMTVSSGPPPPGPPPPAAGLPAAPSAKSSLLAQIHTGIKLKKAEERNVPEAAHEAAESGVIDVAAILQRRVAMEGFSDSDSDDAAGDSDSWSD